MKKIQLNVLVIVLITIGLASCSEKIDFELNNEENSRLVVEGSITDQQKAHSVRLTRTSSYYENQPAPTETGATVSITDGTTTFPLTESSPGFYETDTTVQGVVGNTYTLNITTKDAESYTASSILAPVSTIDTVLYHFVDQIGNAGVQEVGYELLHFGPEPLGLGNNYMWLTYVNDTLVTKEIKNIMFVNDEFVDGNYILGFGFYVIQRTLAPTDTLNVKVEMHSISRDYYEFLFSAMLETTWRGSLFDGPPANVPSNVDNGALGFFRASAVSSINIKVVEL